MPLLEVNDRTPRQPPAMVGTVNSPAPCHPPPCSIGTVPFTAGLATGGGSRQLVPLSAADVLVGDTWCIDVPGRAVESASSPAAGGSERVVTQSDQPGQVP